MYFLLKKIYDFTEKKCPLGLHSTYFSLMYIDIVYCIMPVNSSCQYEIVTTQIKLKLYDSIDTQHICGFSYFTASKGSELQKCCLRSKFYT